MAKKMTGGNAGKNLSTSQKVGIGVGLTATALAAVGGYFLYGSKDAAKNRKQAKSWMLKARAEVLEGLENAKHMTKEEYEALVGNVVKGYKSAKKGSAKELVEFAKDMHGRWKQIERAAGSRRTKMSAHTATGGKKKPTNAKR